MDPHDAQEFLCSIQNFRHTSQCILSLHRKNHSNHFIIFLYQGIKGVNNRLLIIVCAMTELSSFGQHYVYIHTYIVNLFG